jgi:hypothetical protein
MFKKYKFPKQKDPSRIIKEIAKIERRIDWTLPDDYKNHAINFSGFEVIINNQPVITWNVLEIIEVNELNCYLEKGKNILAIGGDGCGNFIGFDYLTKNNPRLILSDMIGPERQNFIEIGKSFTDMYLRLEKGIKWV